MAGFYTRCSPGNIQLSHVQCTNVIGYNIDQVRGAIVWSSDIQGHFRTWRNHHQLFGKDVPQSPVWIMLLTFFCVVQHCHVYSRGQKNVSTFVPFRFVELPFPSESPFIYRWNSFRSVYNRCRTCVRARAVIREMRRPHCEDISSSTYVGELLYRCFAFALQKNLVSLPR